MNMHYALLRLKCLFTYPDPVRQCLEPTLGIDQPEAGGGGGGGEVHAFATWNTLLKKNFDGPRKLESSLIILT